ncbi:UDP-4-amino-4,6-dideoxy-N-acetyl-beta-L-altrosamine transaminase [Desulfonatronum thiosulfatophilum]|uniref:UDP-4-amino-4,6-dideoxy-N-acetyl-beta-L-altrosamine transaminase n=1 Tax=Desulfonatronum thiosulfatophilum TaxID=617002 RepID=A0A1G6DV38_9BACT|nr:UDP-4-amino-4,6-dideoxy-N-acetyl-beta-L-altrosamine transaminase [Desulfonatronum thiosulfatophilum]SDB49057.1 UDP-4-amino-4,6-dideoxy-N-acetyl-beta-L-altrosamine transaminase [Desulfonatronum thiosulfatophilum]
MKTTDKPLLDSNILIYSINGDSPFHGKALDLLVQYTQSGFYVADINLVEFFQVVTDGRKTLHPFSTEQASEYIRKLVRIPQVNVLKTGSFHEILQDEDAHAEIRRLQIKRFAIYDYLIADCMRRHAVKLIITGNARDFRKFSFLDVIDPFTNSLTSDLGTRTSNLNYIPYARQSISEQDVASVCSVLRSDFLTQGPKVPEFEKAIAEYCNAGHAVAVNSGTSALHLACLALGLGPGDTLWTSPITFVASANCALYCGAYVDFVDIDPRTYNLCPLTLEKKLQAAKKNGKLPKVVVPVHFSGQPCDMEAIHNLSREFGFKILEDASHALGARYKNEPVGNCKYSDITVFSFHPVKNITTGEGGMAVTNDQGLAEKMALLRSHGITRDPKLFENERWQMSSVRCQTSDLDPPSFYYEQVYLGFNYRMTDIQAALGLSQLQRLDAFGARRRELAKRHDELLAGLPVITPWQHPDGVSAWHLYVVRLRAAVGKTTHRRIFDAMREQGIGVNLHYIPVHTQPWFRQLGFMPGMFPESEKYYEESITMPLFPAMPEEEQDRVVEALKAALVTEYAE